MYNYILAQMIIYVRHAMSTSQSHQSILWNVSFSFWYAVRTNKIKSTVIESNHIIFTWIIETEKKRNLIKFKCAWAFDKHNRIHWIFINYRMFMYGTALKWAMIWFVTSTRRFCFKILIVFCNYSKYFTHQLIRRCSLCNCFCCDM